ncbi:MAG: hypothetical protein Q8O55_08730 [Dehalococcoidales bacterium]|nr:hypothetical protein [Dehalococcoidales bacterium]
MLKERKCRLCGCTELEACITKEGPCHWVTLDLCSACCLVLEERQLLIAKNCASCAHLSYMERRSFTCFKGRFDGPDINPPAHQWLAWSGLRRPNKTVAKAQRHCPLWKAAPLEELERRGELRNHPKGLQLPMGAMPGEEREPGADLPNY